MLLKFLGVLFFVFLFLFFVKMFLCDARYTSIAFCLHTNTKSLVNRQSGSLAGTLKVVYCKPDPTPFFFIVKQTTAFARTQIASVIAEVSLSTSSTALIFINIEFNNSQV